MRWLIFLSSLLSGATIPIKVIGTTQTQVVLQYTSTAASACTITGTDQNGGPAIADLNATLFTGANLDLSRTVANGFRWPTLVSGLVRTVVIGTHDQIKKGSDGNSYSTSLQADSAQLINVVCDSGADTGSVVATTQNIPYASYYPEQLIPDATQVAFGIQPTIAWCAQGWIPDPMTGVLMKPVTCPTDSLNPSNPMVFTAPVIDVNGGAWTNPANFTTNQVSGTLATTTTVNAPIFAPFAASFIPTCCGISWTDFQVTPYGSASSSSISATYCVSVDSGQTCAAKTPISVTYATGAQAYTAIPSAFPTAYFGGWGGLKTWFGGEDLANRTFSGVSCSGTPTVCTFSGAGALGFNLSRTAGTSFYISSCSSGSPVRLTIATTDSWQQITTQQTSGSTWTNCTYQDLAVGIRAVLNNAGTLNASIQGVAVASLGAQSGSNGARWSGGLSPVTDIATDCAGTVHSPPISGYLLGLAPDRVVLVDQNGLTCLQSNLYNVNSVGHALAVSQTVIPFLSNNTFLAYDFQSPPHIWKAVHVANNYQAITPTFPSSNTVDNFTWTDLGTTASNIGAQVISAGGQFATALTSGLWGPLRLDAVGDNGAGGNIVQFRMQVGSDGPCGIVFADSSLNLISSVLFWGSYPIGWGACHFGGDVGANYSQYSIQAAQSQLSPIFWSATVAGGGPFVSRSSAGMYKNGSLVTWSIPISSCTNASPTVCTSTANNLDNISCGSGPDTCGNSSAGAWIQVSGGTGNWAAINGSMFAHRIDNNTFSLYSDPIGASPINATSFGTFTGTVTATMLPPLYNIPIASVSNNSGNARMVANLTSGYCDYFQSCTLTMKDGDPITIVQIGVGDQAYMHSTAQYYAKVSSAPSGDFDVYLDSGLTSPASYSSLSGMAGGYAALAQTCPDPATLSLPGPLYTDAGIGTTGAGNQFVRCVKIRLHDAGCSDFPATGEHATYPCSSDPMNTARSSLHAWNVGDAIGDVSHFDRNHEIMFVLAVTVVASNEIDVTLERDYGDDPNYGWRGYSGGLADTYGMQHSPGWTPWAEAPIYTGLIQTVASPTFAIPPINGSHNDFVPGATTGNVTQVSGYEGTQTGSSVPDSKINVSISTFTGPLTNLHQSFPFWVSESTNTTAALSCLGGECGQSYPSMRMISGTAPSSEINTGFSWNGDWAAQNIASGNSQNNADGTLGRTLTNIRGGTYDSPSATSIVYLLPTSQTGSVNEKIAPVLVTNWPSGVFVDMSGPSSLITDSNQGSRCEVYTAGECRPNSVVGQVFVAMRNYSDAKGSCVSNNATAGFPCAFGLWPGGGFAVQVRNVPMDTQNLGIRRLTLGWTLPMSHYSFSDWISTPDAKWGLFAGAPIQQRPLSQTYTGTQWFIFKVPPTPPADTVNRTTFVPITLNPGSCAAGDTLRVAFGYAENGNPVSLYGTTRAETTYTSSSATATNPFVFASETQAYATCSAGVQIPAIPGRILYYQFHRKTSAGVESVGTLQALAIP